MNKPTYDQLVLLVHYLAQECNYETLPLIDEVKTVIEYCAENHDFSAFNVA